MHYHRIGNQTIHDNNITNIRQDDAERQATIQRDPSHNDWTRSRATTAEEQRYQTTVAQERRDFQQNQERTNEIDRNFAPPSVLMVRTFHDSDITDWVQAIVKYTYQAVDSIWRGRGGGGGASPSGGLFPNAPSANTEPTIDLDKFFHDVLGGIVDKTNQDWEKLIESFSKKEEVLYGFSCPSRF